MMADDALNYCEGSAAVLQVVRTSAGDNSVKVKNQSVSGRFFVRKGILLSLLSPVPSLNILLQLLVCQVFTDFSDSSDSKNGENYYLKASTENEFSSKSLSFVCDPVGIEYPCRLAPAILQSKKENRIFESKLSYSISLFPS
ncbi:MAG: hypothetical protein IJ891_07040 [Prevotella sp.]|nr:hypothetical protein [Prevotella sp.]